ncbi:uncharacterized protein LJ206_018097 isoform 1-T1 [Theristicus caerulescens]
MEIRLTVDFPTILNNSPVGLYSIQWSHHHALSKETEIKSGLEESPSCTLRLSSSIRWSSKDCVKWMQSGLFQSLLCAISAVVTGLAHASLERQGILLFSLSYAPVEEERINEKDTTTLSSTYYIPL